MSGRFVHFGTFLHTDSNILSNKRHDVDTDI